MSDFSQASDTEMTTIVLIRKTVKIYFNTTPFRFLMGISQKYI